MHSTVACLIPRRLKYRLISFAIPRGTTLKNVTILMPNNDEYRWVIRPVLKINGLLDTNTGLLNIISSCLSYSLCVSMCSVMFSMFCCRNYILLFSLFTHLISLFSFIFIYQNVSLFCFLKNSLQVYAAMKKCFYLCLVHIYTFARLFILLISTQEGDKSTETQGRC